MRKRAGLAALVRGERVAAARSEIASAEGVDRRGDDPGIMLSKIASSTNAGEVSHSRRCAAMIEPRCATPSSMGSR
jgi:hypothetical protein